MLTTIDKVIDGTAYQATTYPATTGLRLLSRLGELVDGDMMRLLVHGDDGGLKDSELSVVLSDPAVGGAIMAAVLKRAAACEGWNVPRELLCCTKGTVQVGNTEALLPLPDRFDDHFAGRYKHMLEVCTWAARVGFGVP